MSSEILFQSTYLVISGINNLHDSSISCSPLTVTDLVIDSLLVRVRDLYKQLSVDEKRILVDFFKSEKPIVLITTRFSAQNQSQLIDELLREGSFTCSRIPSYLKVSLNGVSASQKFYSSFWPTKTPVRPPISHPTPTSQPKHVKVSVYRPQDRFDDRPRRPGGVHVGQRKPVEFKVYKQRGHSQGLLHIIHDYMRSILPNVF